MAGFRRAYDVVQQTIEILDNSEITWFEIDGISLRTDCLTRTLVNLDGNCTPTDEIVQLLGETSRYIRDVYSQSTVCAIQYGPKIYSGECGRPPFEIKEEQLSFLIDQGFQVPVIAQLFRVSACTIERRMTKYKVVDSLPEIDYIRSEMCNIVILRKIILQTCMMSIQDANFDFVKVPCVVFSGKDSADLGEPRRELFRLLMQQGIKEMGLSYDPYGPARAFIAKLLRKSPYEGSTRWREQGRKKPSGPARISYGSSRDAS